MDQRRFPRAKYQCLVRLTPSGPQAHPIATETENVGLGGVCVLMERGLDIFSSVDLEISLSDGEAPMKLQGTIVWVVHRRDFKKGPSFDTGIEFTELSPQNRARLEATIDRESGTFG